MEHDRYENPLCTRYASERMQQIFSPDYKFTTWQRLWLSLAENEMKLGLPVTQEQVDELRQQLGVIDYAAAARYERELRHDVMAHIRAWGEHCPKARGIIHLGATSCYVDDNGDLIAFRDAMEQVRGLLLGVIGTLDDSANRRISIPEAFLAADAILSLAMNVLRGCRVYPEMMARHLADELPFLATENILMRAVSLGGDRQELHEAIREYSVATARRMKEAGCGNDLAERLLADPRFHLDEAALAELMDVRRFVGMAPQQAERYVRGRVLPLLDANRGRAAAGREISC